MAPKLRSITPTFCFSTSTSIFINTTRSSICRTNPNPNPTRRRIQSYPCNIGLIGFAAPLKPAVRAASGPNSPEPTSPTDTQKSVPPLQDDLTYLLKLAAGSILGAALIKYGTAIIPDITRPNIIQALLMISTPVVVAVLLLFIGSHKDWSLVWEQDVDKVAFPPWLNVEEIWTVEPRNKQWFTCKFWSKIT